MLPRLGSKGKLGRETGKLCVIGKEDRIMTSRITPQNGEPEPLINGQNKKHVSHKVDACLIVDACCVPGLHNAFAMPSSWPRRKASFVEQCPKAGI